MVAIGTLDLSRLMYIKQTKPTQETVPPKVILHL